MLTTQSITASVTPSHDPRSLLSILTPPSSHEPGAATPKQAPLSLAPSVDKAKTPASRIFPNSISSESSSQPTANDLATPSTSSQFNPPVGSRLLAFGARAPTAASTKPETSNTTPHAANGMYPHPPAPPNTGHNYTLTNNIQGGGLSSKQQPSETSLNQGYSHMESAQQMFSPFGDRTHLTSALDESRETGHFLHPSDPSRRTSESSLHSELGNPGLSTTQSNSSVDLTNSTGAAQYASGKGSRFAKFFDGKAKDGPPSVKAYTPVGIQSSSPALSQKPDASGLNDVLGPKGDKRSMDDIFAMLSNSAQVSHYLHRVVLFAADHADSRASGLIWLIRFMWALLLLIFHLDKVTALCIRFNTNKCSIKITFPQAAVLKRCTKVAQMIGASCQMDWFPAFVLLGAGKAASFQNQRMTPCNSTLNVFLIHNVALSKCILLLSTSRLPLDEMLASRYSNHLIAVDHHPSLVKIHRKVFLNNVYRPDWLISVVDRRTSLRSSLGCRGCQQVDCMVLCIRTGHLSLSILLRLLAVVVMGMVEAPICGFRLLAHTNYKTRLLSIQ